MARDLVTEVAAEQVAPPAPPPGSARPRPTAAIVFALVLVGAFAFYLNLARRMWFFGDDWDFLASRRLGADDLIRQHGGHLVALPVVVYRAGDRVIGYR